MKILSLAQVIIRITLIIAVSEFIVMQLLAISPIHFSVQVEALIDTIILTALSSPFIYFLVIKPFVTAHHTSLNEIKKLALTDPVTKLANRRLITIHLEKFISGSFRHQHYGAIFMLDLDGFKEINDTHGHNAGDELLIEIGKRISSIVRADDLAGRLGGDEFALLLERIDFDFDNAVDKINLKAITLLSLIQKPFNYNGVNLKVGASIGIKILGLELISAEKALSQADEAMYAAKEAGKGQAKYYDKLS